MLIRPLDRADAAGFRSLRLEALSHHPEAFGASHTEAAAWDIAAFAESIPQVPPAVILGAFAPDAAVPCGMVGLAVPGHAKQRHKGLIWGVYVAPAARGQRHGHALLGAVIAHARAMGLERLQLSVTVGNAAALALYAAVGFMPYGLEREALRLGPGHYVDEELQVLDLRA